MSRRVHFVGIGGAGLSAIARVLVERGERVSGSDLRPSPFSRALEALGVAVRYGHDPANVADAELVVISSAVPADNPEVVAAREAGVPVIRRPAMLAELTRGRRTVAVAGTHGKTTTSGLLAFLLERAGLAPGFIVGGEVVDLGTNARAGQGDLFVLEADEYDRTFLALRPEVALVTNVEHDHPDHYPTPEAFREAFQAFVDRVEEVLVVCVEDPGARSLRPAPGASRVTYGFGPEGDWRAEEVRPNAAGGSDFLLLRGGEVLGLMRTRLPGRHNVLNVLGALAAAEAVGLPAGKARQAVAEFRGTARRFQVLGEAADVVVVDDYAHHPTEVRATLAAARERYPERRLWAVFQPHTFSRTRTFMEDLATSFEAADRVVVMEVYAAREAPDPEFGGAAVAARLRHPQVAFAADHAAALSLLEAEVRPGDVVVILSAGDANEVGRRLLERLAEREDERHG